MPYITFALERYGLLIAFLCIFLGEIGFPLPAFPVLVTAGAFVTKGRIQLIELVSVGVAGSLIADFLWYLGGRRYGGRILGFLCKVSLSPDFCVRQTEAMFVKIGKWSLLVAKFFPALSTISVAMAGITRMRVDVFLLLDGIGALLFVITAVLLGWIFQDAVIVVIATVINIGRFGFLSLVLMLGVYLLARWWRRQAFKRQLRMDRITVAELRKLIEEGRQPLILDVRPKEVRTRAGVIPGAVAAYPEKTSPMAATCRVERDIVVYCACPNEASAAVAASHLKHAGFKKIRPLLGGIDAWIEAGQPLENPPSSDSTTSEPSAR